MCDSIPQRGACLQKSSCRNETLLRRAVLSEKQADKLCSRRGQEFLERIRGSECVGNPPFLSEVDDRAISCRAKYGVTLDMYLGDCNNVYAAFRCYSKFVNERCGALFRWLIDQLWLIGYEVYYPNCDPPTTSKFPKY